MERDTCNNPFVVKFQLNLAPKYWTWMEMTDKDRHDSLQSCSIKKTYSIGASGNVVKLIFHSQ